MPNCDTFGTRYPNRNIDSVREYSGQEFWVQVENMKTFKLENA